LYVTDRSVCYCYIIVYISVLFHLCGSYKHYLLKNEILEVKYTNDKVVTKQNEVEGLIFFLQLSILSVILKSLLIQIKFSVYFHTVSKNKSYMNVNGSKMQHLVVMTIMDTILQICALISLMFLT
jgi:hypothetical protein